MAVHAPVAVHAAMAVVRLVEVELDVPPDLPTVRGNTAERSRVRASIVHIHEGGVAFASCPGETGFRVT